MDYQKKESLLLLFGLIATMLLGVLLNRSAWREQILPPPVGTTLVSILFVMLIATLITMAILRYHTLLLFLLGLFFLAGFVTLTFLMLFHLLDSRPTGLIEGAEMVFYAPLYGLCPLISRVFGYGIGAFICLIFGLVSILCVRRSRNAMSKKEWQALADQSALPQ